MHRLVIFLLPLLLSCMFYGNKMQSSIILTAEVQYPPNEGHVELFFEGVQPQSQYAQIGLISVDGAEFSNDHEIIQKLKIEAWQNGADAVINIKKTGSIREYSGVAVKYTDPTYKIKYVDPTLPIADPSQLDKPTINFKGGIVAGIFLVVITIVGYNIIAHQN